MSPSSLSKQADPLNPKLTDNYQEVRQSVQSGDYTPPRNPKLTSFLEKGDKKPKQTLKPEPLRIFHLIRQKINKEPLTRHRQVKLNSDVEDLHSLLDRYMQEVSDEGYVIPAGESSSIKHKLAEVESPDGGLPAVSAKETECPGGLKKMFLTYPRRVLRAAERPSSTWRKLGRSGYYFIDDDSNRVVKR